MVAMDGIGFGGEARISTDENLISNDGNGDLVDNGMRLVTALQVYACMPARVNTRVVSSSADAVGLIRTGAFSLK